MLFIPNMETLHSTIWALRTLRTLWVCNPYTNLQLYFRSRVPNLAQNDVLQSFEAREDAKRAFFKCFYSGQRSGEGGGFCKEAIGYVCFALWLCWILSWDLQ